MHFFSFCFAFGICFSGMSASKGCSGCDSGDDQTLRLRNFLDQPLRIKNVLHQPLRLKNFLNHRLRPRNFLGQALRPGRVVDCDDACPDSAFLILGSALESDTVSSPVTLIKYNDKFVTILDAKLFVSIHQDVNELHFVELSLRAKNETTLTAWCKRWQQFIGSGGTFAASCEVQIGMPDIRYPDEREYVVHFSTLVVLSKKT